MIPRDTGSSVTLMVTGKMLTQVSQLKCVKNRRCKTEGVKGQEEFTLPLLTDCQSISFGVNV